MQEDSSLGLAGDAASEDHSSCSGQCWGEGGRVGWGKEGEERGNGWERERMEGKKWEKRKEREDT